MRGRISEKAGTDMSEKKGFFSKLKSGLSKTRTSFSSGINSIFSGFSEIDDDFYEELEEQLVMADIGVDTTMRIMEDLRHKVKEEKIKEASACRSVLKDTIKDQMRLRKDQDQERHQRRCGGEDFPPHREVPGSQDRPGGHAVPVCRRRSLQFYGFQHLRADGSEQGDHRGCSQVCERERDV